MVSRFVFQNGGPNMRHSLRVGGWQGVFLPCRWISIIEMFEVSPGDALGVFRSCHQTKPMVTSVSSMFSNRITCLGESSGGGKKKKTMQKYVDLHKREQAQVTFISANRTTMPHFWLKKKTWTTKIKHSLWFSVNNKNKRKDSQTISCREGWSQMLTVTILQQYFLNIQTEGKSRHQLFVVNKLSVFPADSFLHVKPKENSYSIVNECNQKAFNSKHGGSLRS